MVPLDSLPGLVIAPPDEAGGSRRRRLLQQHASNPMLAALLLHNPTVLVAGGHRPLRSQLHSTSNSTLSAAATADAVPLPPTTVTDQGLTVVLEQGSPPASFACEREGMALRVVSAELGVGSVTSDVTWAVATACSGDQKTCTLDSTALGARLGWTDGTRALQAKLVCVCGAGFTSVAAAADNSSASASGCQPCKQGYFRDSSMGGCDLWCALRSTELR